MNASRPCQPAGGFTLVELLVVILIATTLVVFLTALYRMVGRTAVGLSKMGDEWTASQFMRRQYLLLHPATLDFGLFRGNETELAFVSYVSARHGETGPPVLVRYRYEPDRGRLLYEEADLPPWWQDNAPSLNEQLFALIGDWWQDTVYVQIDSLRFGYAAPALTGNQWQTRWDQSNSEPQLVRIELTRLGTRRSLVLETGVLSSSMHSGY